MMMLETTRAETELRRSRQLLHASEVLSGTATTDDVLAAVPSLLCEILGADHAGVVLPGRPSAAPGALVAAAVQERRSRYYPNRTEILIAHPALTDDLERLGWQAVACAPLGGVAVLLLAWDEERMFYVGDRAVITTLVVYVTQALERAARHDARAAITETLQRSMLSPLPDIDGYELAALYRPADRREVIGGDWYDAVPAPHGRLALVIGDVAGHDMAAAARMSQLRSMLRAYLVDRHEPPSALLRRLDAANHALGRPTMATAVMAFVDRGGAGGYRLRWSNAGHPPPVLIQADGEVRSLTGNDMLLGARTAVPRHTYTCPLPPGSTLLLHTDGLVESRDRTIDDGVARLYRRLRAAHTGRLTDVLHDAARDLADTRPDDIAMLAVRIPEAP